ncbi:MAG: acyl-CoA dehydrogenase family protein [Dehalococcoidia bacterium]|nr:acyl-CoA dehydrogenase family protein [Dehalococcoidia bacterium]
MDFSLSEEQEMLKTMAKDLLEKECTEAVVRATVRRQEGYSPEVWKKIADLGWQGIAFPEQYGGTGGGLIDLMVLFEEMGRAMYVSPFMSTVVLCGMTILCAGTEAQKKEFLTKIARGELVIALAMTEPEATWDGNAWEPVGITTSARASGDSFIIDGTKVFVHDAHVADYLLVVARTRKATASPSGGITLFLVDAKSPGIKYTLLKTMSGNHKQSEVVFNKVKVPAESVVGEVGGGWAPLERSIKIGAVMLCAEMVGAGQKVTELTVDYAKTRIQFDMPIGIHQYVQEHCVRCLAYTDTSRHTTRQATWLLCEGRPCDLEVAIAKAWTSEGNERINWHSHQVLAGVGSTEALGTLPLYTRFGNVSQFYLGSPEHYLRKIADELENLPAPEKPAGKRLGLWQPGRKDLPSWDIWREYFEKVD